MKRIMTIINKGTYMLLSVLIVSLILAACTRETAPAPSEKVIDLFMGATSLASGSYIRPVTYASTINKYVPGVRVTVVETGTSLDNVARLRRGQIDIAGIVEPWVIFQAYRGIEEYADKPFTEIRYLHVDVVMGYLLVVRADSDIYTMRDLEGKKVNLGPPGSATVPLFKGMLDGLGVNYEPFTASYGDSATMMKDRRIDALMKASPLTVLDSMLAEIHAFTPLRVIDINEEAYAFIPPGGGVLEHVPAGSIADLKDHPPIVTLGLAALQAVRSDFPDELGYLIIKAYTEHWNDIKVNHPAIPQDNTEATLNWGIVPGGQGVSPFHSGTVRYLEEIGVNVPDFLIPPEFQR